MLSMLFRFVKNFTEDRYKDDIIHNPRATFIRCINKVNVDFRKFFRDSGTGIEQAISVVEKRDGSIDKKNYESILDNRIESNIDSFEEENRLQEKKLKKPFRNDTREITTR